MFAAGSASDALDVNRAVQHATGAALRAIQVVNGAAGDEFPQERRWVSVMEIEAAELTPLVRGLTNAIVCRDAHFRFLRASL